MTSSISSSGLNLAQLAQLYGLPRRSATSAESANSTQTSSPGESESSSAEAREMSILSSLTNGEYGAANEPDASAVLTGPDVTSQFSGGYNVLAIYTQYGSVQYYGGTADDQSATGGASTNAKAMVATFAPGDSAAEKQAMVDNALGYLTEHADDSQDATGQWSRPTFDITSAFDTLA
jgi:hypothetical protein